MAVVLLIALINGLIFVFLLPPWQHYDEPNHFEYVWLVANRDNLPHPGDFDPGMRRDVAKSMVEHGFFEGTSIPLPDLTSEKPWIGQYSQLDDPPLYYFLASLAIRYFPLGDITSQLYAVRLVSLSLFLITIIAGWGVVGEITSPQNPLRFLVPITMALLPAFVDLMTAVNNDVGAIVFFSLFLWGSVRLIQRGFSFWNLLWVLITAGICLLTKRTVYIAVPLLGVVLLFVIFGNRFRRIAWAIIFSVAAIAILVVFSWGDAAIWYRDTYQENPTRVKSLDSPDGNYSFRLQIQPNNESVKLLQIIPVDIASEMSGKNITLGAWIWASKPVEIDGPKLFIYEGVQSFGTKVQINEEPSFHVLSFTPKDNTRRAWILLEPGKDLNVEQPVEIYYDGIVLTEGEFPSETYPIYSQDTWGGISFENFVRNGSAEKGWFYLRPWADEMGSRVFPDAGQDRASLMLYALLDQPATSWYYQRVIESLFRTFWAKFAWGHVLLLGAKPYRFLFVPTLLGICGVIIKIWTDRRQIRKFPINSLFFLNLALLFVWGMAFIRSSNYVLLRGGFVPVARYAYPVIIPTMLLLCVGWVTLLRLPENWLPVSKSIKYWVIIGSLTILNFYSIISIFTHYYG